MSTTETKPTSKDYLNQLYDSQINSTKEQLAQAYNDSASGLDAESDKLKAQKQKNLVATDVEAQRAQRNYAEVQNAYGLTSGAMAQARLAQDNQRQSDMTAIRTAAAEADADVERRRSLLAQQYSSAIKEAQANNDLERAKALYQLAREEEAKLLAQQQAAGSSGSSGGSGSGSASSGGNSYSGSQSGSGASTGTPDSETTVSKEPPAPIVDAPLISTEDYLASVGPGGIAGSVLSDLKKPPAETDNAAAEEIQELTVDMSSIKDLGRGPIGEAELNRLIAAGEVEEYIVGNTIRFRNVGGSTQAATSSQSNNTASRKPSGGAGSGSSAGGLKSQLDRDLLRM